MLDPDTIKQLAAGATGSGLAAWLAKVTGWALVVMFLGGFLAAYFVGPLVADVFSISKPQSMQAVGFVVGFVAILLLRKVHDVIDSIPADSLGGALVEWLRKLLGLPPRGGQEGGGK